MQLITAFQRDFYIGICVTNDLTSHLCAGDVGTRIIKYSDGYACCATSIKWILFVIIMIYQASLVLHFSKNGFTYDIGIRIK